VNYLVYYIKYNNLSNLILLGNIKYFGRYTIIIINYVDLLDIFHFTVEIPRLITFISFIRLGISIKCILKTPEMIRDLLFINDKTKYFYEIVMAVEMVC